jgi:hypothetical protein
MIKVAIIGLPLSGKTTVFKALTEAKQKAEAHILHKDTFRMANVKVPDERLFKLAEVLNPKKVTQAEINFIDEHAMPSREKKGFNLEHSKEADALVCVIRDFENPSVAYPEGGLNPKRDIIDIQTELFINDLEVVQKRIQKIESDIKKGKKELCKELDLMNRLQKTLDSDIPLRKLKLSKEEGQFIKGFEFLTVKKELVLINTDEKKINIPISKEIEELSLAKDFGLMKFSAKIEAELEELEPAERKEFLASFKIEELARDKFIKAVYEQLEVVTFFTVKSEQLKAWTVKRGTVAKEAAGKIHSDIEKGFIKAEVVNFDDFKEADFDFHQAKIKGFLRLEGKDYEVREGDIIDFRFK